MCQYTKKTQYKYNTNTIQYNTNTIQILYNTIQYNTIQYNTIQVTVHIFASAMLGFSNAWVVSREITQYMCTGLIA